MTGYFVLSLDVEIAWGTFDKNGLTVYKNHFENYRRNFDRLLNLMDKYSICATWAVVGHLFLDKCDKAHDDILRPKYSWFGGNDWHIMDPGTDIEKDPYWYGRDIVGKILKLKSPQEIGTHTFSHVIIGDPECTEEIAVSQVKSCIDMAQQLGVKIQSIAFPRNRVGYLKPLSQLGIRTFRGPEKNWYSNTGGNVKRLMHLIDNILCIPPNVYPLRELCNEDGILNIPASQFLMSYDGVRKYIPDASRIKKAERGLQKAIKNDSVFHLWFHPFNLGSSERMFIVVEDIFRFVEGHRQKGELKVCTMGDILSYHRKIVK